MIPRTTKQESMRRPKLTRFEIITSPTPVERERGLVYLVKIGQDKYNKLIRKTKNIMDKIEKIEEKLESNDNITEWKRLMKETYKLEQQLIPQL